MQNIIEGNASYSAAGSATIWFGRRDGRAIACSRRASPKNPAKTSIPGGDHRAAHFAISIGLVLLWLRRLKWHTLVKLLVSVLAGAIFFLWISMAATLETDNPALVRVQEGIRTGYEAVGNAADAGAIGSPKVGTPPLPKQTTTLPLCASKGQALWSTRCTRWETPHGTPITGRRSCWARPRWIRLPRRNPSKRRRRSRCSPRPRPTRRLWCPLRPRRAPRLRLRPAPRLRPRCNPLAA